MPAASAAPASVLPENPERMGLVDQQVGTHLALHRRDLAQRGDVAEHAVDALDDDELVSGLLTLRTTVGQEPQAAIQVLGIVVAEARHRRGAETRAVVDAGMAVGVEQQVVVPPRQRREDAQIGLVAGGEHHRVATSVEARHLLFQRRMSAVGTVGDPRARRSGAFAAESLGGMVHATGIERQAEIVVGAKQQHRASVEKCLGRRQHRLEGDRKGIPAGFQKSGIGLLQATEFREHGLLQLLGGFRLGGVCLKQFCQIPDGLDVGDTLDGNNRVELGLDSHDEIHNSEGVELQVPNDVGICRNVFNYSGRDSIQGLRHVGDFTDNVFVT